MDYLVASQKPFGKRYLIGLPSNLYAQIQKEEWPLHAGSTQWPDIPHQRLHGLLRGIHIS